MASCLVGGRWCSSHLSTGEWKPRRKINMQTTQKNRRGLALGAIFALVASLFGSVPAANAATDGAEIAIYPLSNKDVTNFGGLLTEDFGIYAELKQGQSTTDFASGTLLWKIERVSGAMDVLALATTVSAEIGSTGNGITDITTRASTSATVVTTEGTSATASEFVSVWAGSSSATVSARIETANTGFAPLYLRATTASPGVQTASPSVTIRVTAFLDTQGGANGVQDPDEWYTTKTITLRNTQDLAPTLTVGAPARDDLVVTASATLTALNWSNLNGKPFLAVSTSDTTAVFTKVNAGAGTQVTSSAQTGAVITARAGVISESFVTNALTESTKIGIQLRYIASGDPTNATSGVQLGGGSLGAWTYATVAAPGADALSISSVASAFNVTGGGQTYTVRQNQTYTVKVKVTSNSASVSGAVVTVTTGGTALATSSRTLSVNGGALMTTHGDFTVTSGADGYASFTLAASGFVDTNTITLQASIGNIESTLVTLTNTDPAYTVYADFDRYLTAPGTAVSLGFTVKDQYLKPYALSDGYLKVTRGGTGFAYATTVSYHAVAAATGTGTVAFTPEAATTTGSATVEADFVVLSNGAYVDSGTDADVTINVSSATSTFGTGLATSYSASVSYFPSTVSWTTVTGKVTNTGSAVAIAGSDLIFRVSADTPATTSNAITVRADGTLGYSFQVASLKSGSHTFTLTNGSASTTSLLVVSGAAYTSAATITFDTTAITAGRTKIVTGQVLDANGNGVYSAGTASLTVTYTGTAGIPVGSMPTSTDVDGKFVVSILTSAADEGSFTLTAVYAQDGASTAAADKISAVQAISVGSGVAVADQKVNAGSFKGYVAVYAKGYEGQRLSAKVGNDWVVVPALASNFVRVVEFTGAGYTIAVRIYIDRVLVDTITVTTK